MILSQHIIVKWIYMINLSLIIRWLSKCKSGSTLRQIIKITQLQWQRKRLVILLKVNLLSFNLHYYSTSLAYILSNVSKLSWIWIPNLNYIQFQMEKENFVVTCFLFQKPWNQTFSHQRRAVKVKEFTERVCCTCRIADFLIKLTSITFRHSCCCLCYS